MAFPTVEQAIESSTNTAGTSHVVTLPTATAGQLLLIILDKGSTSATINAHGSLTELLDENLANGLYIAYRWMDGGEPASYTLTSSASTRSAVIAYRISGALNPSAQAPQIGTTGSGSSATPDPPSSVAPGGTKDYLFIAFYGAAGEEADDDTWSDTPPTNYTPSPPRQKSCGTAGTNLGGMIATAERQLNTGSAQDPGTFAKDVSAAWRSQTILVTPQEPTSVTPGTATLTTSRFAPTVSTTANQRVTPGVATLTTSIFAPTVSTPRLVTPGAAALATSAFAPTISTPVLVTPGAASLTTSAFAPTISTPVLVTPGAAALTTSAFAPTISTPVLVTPGAAALATSAFAPTISTPVLVTPGAASLTTSAFAPTVSTGGGGGITLTPGAAALTLTTFAPEVSNGQVLVTPGAATLVLTTFAPEVRAPIYVGPAQLTLTTFAPTVWRTWDPGEGADAAGQAARAAVQFNPFRVGPQSVNPVAGIDDLAFLVPVDEPLSVGVPPVAPTLCGSMQLAGGDLVRSIPDSAGYMTGAPLEVAGARRPVFMFEWNGHTLADRNLIVAFLRGLDLPTEVGHERSAFDVELDGPGSGITKVRPIEPFLDEQVGMSTKAYRVRVRCEEVW